ncbi:unnamed protein product [Echinostoma caproni]|uniref:Uncharacterized protein n=1 Tax=Echinostoma caproni TaxID=27848 RepID=A0A3P8GTC2_9TREM|nr:unnamed protein product [Echinostoma caproni]
MEEPLHRLLMDIPMTRWKDIPVYLAATAGMRLTLLQDPLSSLGLFDALRRGLSTSGLQVQTPNERIRLLSGSEEGLFGWVSVNSVLGLVTAKRNAYEILCSFKQAGSFLFLGFSAKLELI